MDGSDMRQNNKQDTDRLEPLPTDGLEVEECRDNDTQRLFMLEWRRRAGRDPCQEARVPGRTARPRDMMPA
jgi:hypothetical protein